MGAGADPFRLPCPVLVMFYDDSVSFSVDFSVHEGQKFKCSLCDAMYGLKSNLNRHIKRTHDEKKESLKCSLCDITFLNDYRKVKHIKSVH